MNKQAFTAALRERLSGLPREDIERSIEFYCEMIDDRTEEGLSEEEAISEIGSVEEVASQIMSEIPLSKLVIEKVAPRRSLRAWEIVLLVLGCPIWLSLLAAAFVVVLSVYIAIWSVAISLWAVEAAVAGCALAGVGASVLFALQGNGWIGLAMLGAGLVCAGVAILLFWGCKEISKGIVLLTKKSLIGIKTYFIRKGDAK